MLSSRQSHMGIVMVAKCYFELRKSVRTESSITADVMRHLHTRQHLGKAVIVCDQPHATLSAARKQWLKLSRSLQKQRSSTLNADKILKYTHAVTRMQRMHFTSKSPVERPEADIYFLRPDELEAMPLICWTVYMLCPNEPEAALPALRQLPEAALIVDYCQSLDWPALGVLPKKELESTVQDEWGHVQRFLKAHSINVNKLITGEMHNVEAMDDALDTLLGGHSQEFMQLANEFQRALELSRPLRLNKTTRTSYDTLILLAHRVQALTPGAFHKHFLEVYNENDTFFLYDVGRRLTIHSAETISEAHARHSKAGRHHLARSLQALAINSRD